jgi:hypothetical protein
MQEGEALPQCLILPGPRQERQAVRAHGRDDGLVGLRALWSRQHGFRQHDGAEANRLAHAHGALLDIELGVDPPRDPVRQRAPAYVVDRGAEAASAGGDRYEVLRAGDRCAALHGGELVTLTTGPGADRGPRRAPFRCVIYDDRPRTCRDFTAGSAHCLTARRRVGLTLG